MGEQFDELMVRYKALLNKNDTLSYQITEGNSINIIAGIREALMIRRTGDSNRFNRPIINLPKHHTNYHQNSFSQFLPAVSEKNREQNQAVPGQIQSPNSNASLKTPSAAAILGFLKLLDLSFASTAGLKIPTVSI